MQITETCPMCGKEDDHFITRHDDEFLCDFCGEPMKRTPRMYPHARHGSWGVIEPHAPIGAEKDYV